MNINLWTKILAFLTGLEKLVELASSYWKRRKREKEIKEVKKENEEIHEKVENGTVEELNKEFGWEEPK
jgi:hypothetical protein